MAERFNKLFSLPANLYAEECPVMIEAGALYKDTETGRILAQMKLKNVSEKSIISCKVMLKAFQVNGTETAGAEYVYSDINADTDKEFGVKKAIYFSDELTREYTPAVKEVVFADKSIWNAETELKPLPKQKFVGEVIDDIDLVSEYKKIEGDDAVYYPEMIGSLYGCTCGHINKNSKCAYCGREFSEVFKNCRTESLYKNLDNTKENQFKQKDKNRKHKKVVICALLFAVIIAIIVAIFTLHMKPSAIDKIKNSNIGDEVIYGSDDSELTWVIVSKTSDRALLVLKDTKYMAINTTNLYKGHLYNWDWASSDIRYYLNNDFYINSFTDSQRERIVLTYLSNDDNLSYGDKYSGYKKVEQSNTSDYVFILSAEEYENYITSEINVENSYGIDDYKYEYLRCPVAYFKDYKWINVYAAETGKVGISGFWPVYKDCGFTYRPAIWVDIT